MEWIILTHPGGACIGLFPGPDEPPAPGLGGNDGAGLFGMVGAGLFGNDSLDEAAGIGGRTPGWGLPRAGESLPAPYEPALADPYEP